MSTAAQLQSTAAKSPLVSKASHAGLLLQRKCACGGPASSSLSGECEECNSKRLQKKLSIGASNDSLEQEADRVANQVLAVPPHSAVSGAPLRIQSYMGQATEGSETAPASVDQTLAGPGRPLEPALREDMEQRFGHDFSRVRVHTGGAAGRSARYVNANAYTVGHNVVFGVGRFAPGIQEGRRLIAHELTHVVQQSGSEGMRLDQSDEKRGLSPTSQRGPVAASALVSDVVASPGQHLDAATRAFMEPRFGRDLSHVRVHTGSRAAESAKAVQAKAYTVGQDVVFGQGQFAPWTYAGRELLAHEVAHTMQQRSASGSPPVDDAHSLYENSARAAARSIASGERLQQDLPASGVGLARQPNDEERARLIAEAEAALAAMEAEEEETAQEEAKDEAARQQAIESIAPTTLSLLGPEFEASLITDEEIYESIRERTPEEPEYWEHQEPEWLDKSIKLGSETKYIRRWQDVTIEGVGDQGDRTVAVDDSHWSMTGPALRGYLEYMVGELTPFEESLVRGEVEAPDGFNLVAAGEEIGYHTRSGPGNDIHTIYNRDGTIARSWNAFTSGAAISEGIGPLALALPGGYRSLGRSGVSLARTGALLGRSAVRAGRRLLQPAKRAARKGLITAKLAIGRAEAGAASAAPTALGQFASRKTAALVETRAARVISQRSAAQSAVQTERHAAAVPSIPSPVAAGVRAPLPPFPSVTLSPTNVAAARPTLAPIAGATEVQLSEAQYQAALQLTFPGSYFDQVAVFVDQIGARAAARALADPRFVATINSRNVTLAGTLFHSAAAAEARAAQAGLGAGWTVQAEQVIQRGLGGSRADLLFRGPGGLIEIDWKTSVISGLSTASRREMTRHAGQITTNIGGTLASQESRSWIQLVKAIWPGTWPW